jgi:hypothetical protein
LPASFKDYHLTLLENSEVTEDEIKKAKEVLEKAEKQKDNTSTIVNVDNPLSLERKPLSAAQKSNQILY